MPLINRIVIANPKESDMEVLVFSELLIPSDSTRWINKIANPMQYALCGLRRSNLVLFLILLFWQATWYARWPGCQRISYCWESSWNSCRSSSLLPFKLYHPRSCSLASLSGRLAWQAVGGLVHCRCKGPDGGPPLPCANLQSMQGGWLAGWLSGLDVTLNPSTIRGSPN